MLSKEFKQRLSLTTAFTIHPLSEVFERFGHQVSLKPTVQIRIGGESELPKLWEVLVWRRLSSVVVVGDPSAKAVRYCSDERPCMYHRGTVHLYKHLFLEPCVLVLYPTIFETPLVVCFHNRPEGFTNSLAYGDRDYTQGEMLHAPGHGPP